MELDQIYHNASTMFQHDPELRNLLMRTLDQANANGLPAIAQNGQGGMLTPGVNAPELMVQSNAAAKGAPMPAAPGAARNPLVPAGPNPPQPEQPVAAGPTPGPAPGTTPAVAPGLIPTSAPMGGRRPLPPAVAPRGPVPQAPAASGMDQLSAFLRGLGTSDAILPALGGGMAAVQGLEKDAANKNQTVRALMGRGLDAETASAAANNPDILKAVLPALFGDKNKVKYELGSDYDSEGQERKFFYNPTDPSDRMYTGSSKSSMPGGVNKTQATANIKRVEQYKGQADQARQMLGTIGQIETLRKGVPGAIKGLPGGMGSTVAGWTDYFGVTNGAKALDPQALDVQLGFTERTKGAITEREMALFAGGTPGFNMTDAAANKAIAAMKAGGQRQIERSKFFEAWLGKNKYSLEGAQDAWDAYITANPVIDVNPDGTLRVNTTHIGNWRDYVSGPDEDRASTRGPVAGDTSVRESSTPDSVNGSSGPLTGGSTTVPRTPGATAAPTSSEPPVAPRGGSIPTITTKEERDALPSGTQYIHQGQTYTKR